MEVEIVRSQKEFEPITVKLTIKSLRELNALVRIFTVESADTNELTVNRMAGRITEGEGRDDIRKAKFPLLHMLKEELARYLCK